MLTATPPFGYHGGEDLQRRITAGIPSRRGSSEANEGGKEEEREMMHSDTKRTDGEAILATDYLPVVRRVGVRSGFEDSPSSQRDAPLTAAL